MNIKRSTTENLQSIPNPLSASNAEVGLDFRLGACGARYLLETRAFPHIYVVQHAFDPAGIEFNTFPTMAQHIVGAMLPEHDGKIHKLSLHERKLLWLEMCIYDTFCIFIIFCIFDIFLSQQWMAINLWISIGLTPC